jgi:hypothetical protein
MIHSEYLECDHQFICHMMNALSMANAMPSIFFRPFFVFFLDNQVVCWFNERSS